MVQAAEPLAQDYSVVWHNPDSEYYVEGCGLAHLPDGSFLAAVPVVPRQKWQEERRMDHSVIHLVRSSDGGKTWNPLSELPYYSAVPWQDHGKLYLFAFTPGPRVRNDDLLLLSSEDGGKTWSKPVTLFKGHFWNCQTGMVIRDGRLYWVVDDLALGPNRGPRLIVGDLKSDPMKPESWRMSAPVPFPGAPEMLTNARFAGLPSQYLEPNVIEVNGQIRVLMTVKLHRQTTAGLCAVLDASETNGEPVLKFRQYSPMPGGQLKFCVLHDDVSQMFWTTANLTVSSQGDVDLWQGGAQRDILKDEMRIGGNDRRFLMLLYGLDGLNWLQAGCIAQAARIKQSFNYAAPLIDGDDLVLISRSAVDAPNQHDADYATFHRVHDFRKLALHLLPEPEKK